MTAPRDPDRLIRAFLSEGDEVLQDQVYDAVRAAIEHKRQRVVFGPWRTPIMSRFVTFGLGAAAVVVIGILLGAQLLRSPTQSNVGGEPTPTREPTSQPTSTPAGMLPIGPHLLVDGSEGEAPVSMTVTLVAPGWYGEPGVPILQKNGTSDPPDGAGLITFADSGEYLVYGDPCAWSTTRPDTPATTPEELVTALAAQALRDASEPTDITLDGYAGKAITLHVPDDINFIDCDELTFGSWGFPGPDETPFRYHQGRGQIDEIWALDVDGHMIVIDWAYYADTPQAVVDELRAIVESATIQPD